MLPCLTHISMIWRNARRIWTPTCHPAKTPVRWMHHNADWRWIYKWTRHVADKATDPYKPHSCSSEDHYLEVLNTYLLFRDCDVLIQGNQSSLLSSERCKEQGFDLLPLQLYVCFVFVLFIYLGKLQTKRSCWPVLLPFYHFNIECCQCGVGWSSHCQNMMQSLSLAAEAWFGTFIIIIMWSLKVIFKEWHWNIRSLQPAVNWYLH